MLGNIVPVDLEPSREHAVTVASTALPIFSFTEGSDDIALPATSIFTIDTETKKFISVHNMFDIGKIYAALNN
ncbi:hypothetical protein RLPCCGM1_p0029 [Rhizobium leguminosarum bv. phaseoli CCGM1]|nr:hypothetical protein RLPCCGM1_p0029 [Rhizobium leguminosarum bv. phaseoli CCGM1]